MRKPEYVLRERALLSRLKPWDCHRRTHSLRMTRLLAEMSSAGLDTIPDETCRVLELLDHEREILRLLNERNN